MRIITLALVATLGFGASAASAHPRCSPHLKHRTPEQVLEDHRAAIAAQDWVAVGCNYSRHAVVISDMGITEGRADIVIALQGLSAAFGGVQPVVIEQIVAGNMVRLLFTLDLGFLTIPDGIDTYIIRRGKIVNQTAHGLAVFVGPPPPPPAP